MIEGVIAALQGRRGLKYGSRPAGWYKMVIFTIAVIGGFQVIGIIVGIDTEQAFEIVTFVTRVLYSLIGSLTYWG